MHDFYYGVIDAGASLIGEPKVPYLCLTERHLQAMWLDQKYFKSLVTPQGEKVKVISPGIWNREAGPDFLKAHLQIGERECRGDIEIHLSAADWKNHQHHCNPKYDQVILHVSFAKPEKSVLLLNSQGVSPFQVFLEPALTIPLSRILQLMDLDLYPYKKFVERGKCSKDLFQHLPLNKTKQFFQSAALWRLVRKREHLLTQMPPNGDLLGLGIARALGYKNNSEAFMRIYQLLLPHKSLGQEPLLALALGAAGFFSLRSQKKWEESEFYRHLRSLHMMYSFSYNLETVPISVDKIRPYNHPLRRLAALSHIVVDKTISQRLSEILLIWQNQWCLKKWESLRQRILLLLPDPKDSYWNHHFTFASEASTEHLALMGNTLKQELLINTILPFLYDHIIKKSAQDEAEAFYEFYASLHSSEKSKTRYLKYRFFEENSKGELLQRADLEQGAYQLHHDFCLHFEASCSGCPFVEKFEAVKLMWEGRDPEKI